MSYINHIPGIVPGTMTRPSRKSRNTRHDILLNVPGMRRYDIAVNHVQQCFYMARQSCKSHTAESENNAHGTPQHSAAPHTTGQDTAIACGKKTRKSHPRERRETKEGFPKQGIIWRYVRVRVGATYSAGNTRGFPRHFFGVFLTYRLVLASSNIPWLYSERAAT